MRAIDLFCGAGGSSARWLLVSSRYEVARNRAVGGYGRRCARHRTRQRTARARESCRDDESSRRLRA